MNFISGKKIVGSWGGGIEIEKDKKLLVDTYNNQFLKSPLKKLIKIWLDLGLIHP